MDCSMPGLTVLHNLPELAQTHVHWVSDAIQPSHLGIYMYVINTKKSERMINTKYSGVSVICLNVGTYTRCFRDASHGTFLKLVGRYMEFHFMILKKVCMCFILFICSYILWQKLQHWHKNSISDLLLLLWLLSIIIFTE